MAGVSGAVGLIHSTNQPNTEVNITENSSDALWTWPDWSVTLEEWGMSET